MDKRFQQDLIAISREHLKKHKRRRRLKPVLKKTALPGGSGVLYGSASQPETTG